MERGGGLGVLVGAEQDGRFGVRELVARAPARRGACSAASGSGPPSRRRRRRRRARGSCRSASRRGRRGRARPPASRPRAGRSARRAPRRSSPTPRKSIATRAGVVRARSRIQRSSVSAQELLQLGDEPLRLLPHEEMAGSRGRRRAARPGIASTSRSRVARIDDDVAVSVCTSVGTASEPSRRCASKRRPRGGLRRPVLERLRRPLAVDQDPVDELRPRIGLERVLVNWRSVARASISSTVLLRHRERLRPAGRRAREHELVDPLRMGERELLRDHPAEARPDHVRALDPASSSTCTASPAISAAVYGPGGRVALADAAVVEEDHVERAGERLDHRLPAPARVAEPVDQQQRRPAPWRSQAIFIASPRRPAERRSTRTRRPRPASPPGTKKTSRMKSVPRMKRAPRAAFE